MKQQDPEFSIDFYSGVSKKGKHGGTTVAILTVSNTGIQYRGIAHCNPNDEFNPIIGQKIAEARARKQYFKAEANDAYETYMQAKRLVEITKKKAEKKANRYSREEKWLTNYVKSV